MPTKILIVSDTHLRNKHGDEQFALMKPGSLFISNSFPVPGATPDQVIEVDCTPPRPLYCYQR